MPVLYCPDCGKPMTATEGPLPASLECPHCQHVFPPNVPPAGREGVVRGYRAGEASPKSRLVAGLLGIFLGWLGFHRFYLGYWGIGILMILVSAASTLLCLKVRGLNVGFIWGLIEGILCLAGKMRDAQGRPVVNV